MAALFRLLLLSSAVAAIYPDDHWSYSTKLTVGSFDSFIKSNVDGGKTVFEFKGADYVAFGDVNLQEEPIRDAKYGPGAGGWPTIRYFNAETGYDGAPYTKKTSKSMCDELGSMEYMRAYVTDKAVPPCPVSNPDSPHCTDRERSFLAVWAAKSPAALQAEIQRLEKMSSAKTTTELLTWLQQRRRILAQLLALPTSNSGGDGKTEL